MSYVSTLIGKITRRKQRTHAQAAALADATQSVLETLEGRELLSAVSISSPSVAEGGDLVYTVSLNTASSKKLTVNYNLAGGTAKAGRDYVNLKPGKLTFAAGETSKTITVHTRDNHLFTANKTVQLRLSGVTSGNSLKRGGLGTGTIINTDAAPVITVNNKSVKEGNNGTKKLTFTVKMTGGSENPVQVRYATQDVSATSTGKNADYNKATGTLVFTKAGTKTISVIIRGDKIKEADEAFLVNFTSVGKGTSTIVNPLVPDKTYAVGSIINDDGGSVASGNVVTAVPTTVNISPGGTAGVAITLNRVSADPVTVTYSTANGTASAGTDFTATTGSVTLNPGETSKVITIPVSGLATTGTNFTFTVSSPTGNATLGSPATSTINIVPSASLPGLSVGDVSVTEGNAGTKAANFTISLASASTQPITVGYTFASGTATLGTDFTATDGTVTFAPGETSKTVTAQVIGDTDVESNETFTLTLGQPVNAPITNAIGTATIINDDIGTAAGVAHLVFNGPTGHTFTLGSVSNFHYDITNTGDGAASNAQLKFYLVHSGQDVNTLTPYKTVNLGTIAAGANATGDVDLSGSPSYTIGSGDRYETVLVANGVVQDTSKSIAL